MGTSSQKVTVENDMSDLQSYGNQVKNELSLQIMQKIRFPKYLC